MADYTHTGLELVGLHVPDYSLEMGPDGNRQQVELPGRYLIGTVIDGVFVPLVERKAAGLFADIERMSSQQGQQQGQQSAASQSQGQPSDQGQGQMVQPQQTGTGTEAVVLQAPTDQSQQQQG